MILTKKIESSSSIDVTMEDGRVPEKLLTCTSVLPVANKTEKESIHSGQFMVSQFEAEETMDDLVDSEVKMLDPEDPNLLKLDEVSTCLEVQLYIPRKLGQINELENNLTTRLITSQIEIETSLTKLFKCMNLAYSQKLTSPKWNHFKGVRLRWKDKIRLNNVIWRCWHMQFILKRRTPVVQFASPLDVDVHSNPQSVVLEGKYWKRQLTVIKAEYRKWRRNYKLKSIGCLTLDTKSEFDFLEWSSLNEKNCILSDDWTSDALFSAINVPFPFPDPREIARGAGIADFIQPSLGPLQPNLDDIDITFADLVHDSRLPSVPEEGSDEVLKNYEYGFSAIIEHDQIDSSVVMDEATTNIVQMENNNGTHMVELNTPRNTMQFIEQQFITREEDTKYKTNANSRVSNDVIVEQHNNSSSLNYTNRKKFLTNDISSNKSNEIELTGKGIKKGRISKNFHRFFRREPHNYDKAQPTAHQTTIYQQMLSEQNLEQSSQHHILSNHDTCMEQSEMLTFREHLHLQTPEYTNSLLINSNRLHISNPKVVDIKTSNGNTFDLICKNDANAKELFSEHISSLTASNQSSQLLLNVKIEPSSSDVFSMFNVKPTDESFGDESQAFKKSTSTGPHFKKGPCDRNGAYLHEEIRMREHDNAQSLPLNLNSAYPTLQSSFKPTCSHQEHQPLSPKQNFIPKEIFRSNSLPLNVSHHDTHNNNFTVPQYHAKNMKSHSLRNSVNQYVTSTANNLSNMLQVSQRIQPITNDPISTNTMDRLLTASQRISLSKEKLSTNVSRNLYEPINPVSSNYQMQVKNSNLVNHMKSISLPEPAVSESLRSSRSAKMLSYPPSITCSTKLKVSTEIFTEQDGPLSSISYVPRDNQRRAGHIHSEQKRRYNIKNGFDMLHSLIPHLQENCKIAKLSKAAMLQKGADHIKQLRTERNFLQEKINELINERDCLNTSLTHLHTMLPANGAPLLRQRSNHVLLLFEKYVRFRTSRNWKFWVLGFILEPLLTSYSSSVSNANMEEMCRTAFLWIDQHCSLIDLRPVVSNKLKYLSMKTDILSDSPSTLHEEIMKALNNTSGQHPNLHGP